MILQSSTGTLSPFCFSIVATAPPFPPLNNSRYPVSFALPSTFAVGQRYAICLKFRLLPYAKYMVPFSLLIVSSSLYLPRQRRRSAPRSEEHTSELQSRPHLVC